MNLQGQGEQQTSPRRHAKDDGYAMAALLVTIAVMAVLMTVAMPTWRQQAKREKEAELIWRAGQYVHAIELYKRKFANAYPTSIDVLVKGRFLRKKYLDPMTKNGEFRLISPQELQGTPTRMLNLPGNDPSNQAGFGARRPFGSAGSGSAGSTDNRLGSGTAMTGSGLGSNTGGPGTTPGGGSRGFGSSGFGSSGSGSSGPGTGSGLSPDNQPGTSSGPGGTIQVGPIAAVASRSTDQSIRIFKGRDHYNQWIVTIEDVVPRQFLRQQQPNQPGQTPGQNPSNAPGRTSPSPTTPTSPIR